MQWRGEKIWTVKKSDFNGTLTMTHTAKSWNGELFNSG